MLLDEPTREDVEKAVESLKLVLELINHDPAASGMKAMAEAVIGVSIGDELAKWLRNPTEKREVRNEFIRRMKNIWRDSHGDNVYRLFAGPSDQR